MLTHGLLSERGVEHGFGVRGAAEPTGVLRPQQVHGSATVDARACRADRPPEADAVVSRDRGVRVGVVTADCLPLLLANADGSAVAAVHAGWRGLAQGVVRAGVDALRRASGVDAAEIVAAIGPHIGGCCYEVDAPVLDALETRFASALAGALRPSTPGHAYLDLAALARHELGISGLRTASIGAVGDACTFCDAQRFHSYRRDGARSGRLLHFVAVRQENPKRDIQA